MKIRYTIFVLPFFPMVAFLIASAVAEIGIINNKIYESYLLVNLAGLLSGFATVFGVIPLIAIPVYLPEAGNGITRCREARLSLS